MDNTIINPIFVIVPIILAIIIMSVLGWRRKKAQERADAAKQARLERIKNARIPEGAGYIYSEATGKGLSAQLHGSFMVVAVGTFALNQVYRLLTLLQQCGREQLVGSVLVIENDVQERAKFHRRLHDVFHDRIVYGHADAYGSGMSNQTPEQILETIDIWGVPVARATAEVIDIHLRRNGSRSPSDVLFFLSQGGHAPIGLPVLDVVQERFPDTFIVGFTSLPRHERLRTNFASLKAAYEERGVVGWVLEDDLGQDPVTSDYGMVAAVAGLAEAALEEDKATAPNNALRLTFTQEPGSLLVYQVMANSVVGYRFQPDPDTAPRYFVFKQPMVEEITKSVRRIEQGKGIWSADLPVGEETTSTFDIVMASLRPDDLREVKDDVVAGQRLRATYRRNGTHTGAQLGVGRLFGQANYEAPFASIATPINPEKPVCPIIVVRLMTVRNGKHLVEEIIKAPAKRSLVSSQQPPSLPNSNGKRVRAKAKKEQTV